MNEIQETLKGEIGAAHSKALQKVESARGEMSEAVEASVYVATLVHKASRMHKSDLAGYLREYLSGEEVKRYLSLYDAQKKRDALQDKRQLQLCGILDSQEVVQPEIKSAKPQQGLITLFSRTRQELKKKLTSRPVDEWGESEREQVREVLKPFIELYGEL